MKKDNHQAINRRDFLKIVGISTATTAPLLSGCSSDSGMASGSGSSTPIPTDRMTYRTTPSTKDKVSILGYGCMRLPTIAKNSARDSDDEIDQEMVNRLTDYAIEHGVNYFDTSPAYCKGRSEHAMGIALSRYPRDKYYIATKLSNFSPDTWSREASIAMYNNSLKELQVDYLDYMLLHGIGMGGMEAYENRYIKNGILDFLLEERKAGRIRNLGFSYHGDIEVFDYLLSKHDEYQWDFVQIQLNYLDWKHAKEINPRNTDAEYLYGELQKRGIPAIIMEPLLGGRLSNVHDHIVARLKQREPGRSVASWAFRFAGSFPGVLTVLSGMTYMEHLQDNLRTYCPLQPLTEEENRFLFDTADLMMQYPTIPCNDCKYCMPCPYGIDIPGILLHYNKCVNEGNVPQSGQDENYRKARRAYLIGYDRSVPKRKYSINSLVYWVTYVHNVVYSFYRSMIYCYINSTQRCAGSIVIDIIPTNGADKRKFFPFAPYFPVTNVIKRYFYPYFPAIIGIKGYSFPYFPYLSGIMKIKTALYSLFSRLDWHKTVVFPCLGEIYEGIRSLSWEIPVT